MMRTATSTTATTHNKSTIMRRKKNPYQKLALAVAKLELKNFEREYAAFSNRGVNESCDVRGGSGVSSSSSSQTHFDPRHVLSHLEECLGVGSYGCVYAYRDQEQVIDECFAVKCLNHSKLLGVSDDKLQQRNQTIMATMDLVLEGAILSKLDHPNIIKLHASNISTDDEPFLVLELLAETMNPQWMPSILERWENTVVGIVSAMKYLHTQKGIVLRDLKPENIGFDKDGIVKLFDFGMARHVQDSSTVAKDFDDDDHAGTLRYMAPERMLIPQQQQQQRQDRATVFARDVYSFAIVVWELLHEMKPYAEYETQLVQAVACQHARPIVSDEFPNSVHQMLTACWHPDPKERPTFQEIENHHLPKCWNDLVLLFSQEKNRARTLSTSSCESSIATATTVTTTNSNLSLTTKTIPTITVASGGLMEWAKEMVQSVVVAFIGSFKKGSQ